MTQRAGGQRERVTQPWQIDDATTGGEKAGEVSDSVKRLGPAAWVAI